MMERRCASKGKTSGRNSRSSGLQTLRKVGSSRRIPPPTPLPSLKKSEESNPIQNDPDVSSKMTSWSSVVKAGIETNTSSHKLSDIQKSDEDLPKNIQENRQDRALCENTKQRSWSGVVRTGLKQDTDAQSVKQREDCQQIPEEGQADHNVNINDAQGGISDSTEELILYKRATATRHNGSKSKNQNKRTSVSRYSGFNDGTHFQRPHVCTDSKTKEKIQHQRLSASIDNKIKEFQKGSFKKEALDERPLTSRHIYSKEETVLQVSSSLALNGTDNVVDEPVTSARVPSSFDSVANRWCEIEEEKVHSVPEISIEQKTTVAEEIIPELSLRPHSDYMAVTKAKPPTRAPPSVVLGSDEDNTLLCMPCDRDGTTLPAFGYCTDCCEHLCQSCFNHHKKATPSRHHALLDKAAMPSIQHHPTTKALMDPADEFITYCVKHKPKTLEFFCTRHRQLACSVCVMLDHRLCDIGYIPELAVNCIDSREYYDTSERMETVTQLSNDIRQKTTEVVKLSNDSLKGVLPEIKQFRQKINEHVDKLENDIKSWTEDLCEDNEKKLKRTEVTCDYIERSVVGISSKVKQLNANKQADKLFIALVISDYILNDHEAKISKLQSDKDVCEYRFVPDANILSLIDDTKSMGSILRDAEGCDTGRAIHGQK